jgi:hypothetical protein
MLVYVIVSILEICVILLYRLYTYVCNNYVCYEIHCVTLYSVINKF